MYIYNIYIYIYNIYIYNIYNTYMIYIYIFNLDLAGKEFAISKSKNLFYVLTGFKFSTLIMINLFIDSKLMSWHLKILVTRWTICSPNIISMCVFF